MRLSDEEGQIVNGEYAHVVTFHALALVRIYPADESGEALNITADVFKTGFRVELRIILQRSPEPFFK
jgi:hypothetical protein